MQHNLAAHLPIFSTLILTLYSQVAIKLAMEKIGPLPTGFGEKTKILMGLLANPWIFSSIFATLIGTLFWIAALNRFPIGYAYACFSLLFPLVAIVSMWMFGEVISLKGWIGILSIMVGIALIYQK